VLATMPERAKRWLRFNPVFETAEEARGPGETYRAFAY
jgi:hypothetical protein